MPLRSLADLRFPSSHNGNGEGKRRSWVKALSVEVEGKLSLRAPATVGVGNGFLQLGDDQTPGIADLHAAGQVGYPPRPGALRATAAALDATIKDVFLGGVGFTADRLHLGPVEGLEIVFDGVRPVSLRVQARAATATNLSIFAGGHARS